MVKLKPFPNNFPIAEGEKKNEISSLSLPTKLSPSIFKQLLITQGLQPWQITAAIWSFTEIYNQQTFTIKFLLMKFKNIYTVAAVIGLFVLLQSRSGGPATQANLRVTGAPNEGTCGNNTCHTAGAFDPSVTIELLEGDDLVAKYEPGKTYTLRITNTPGTSSPAGFGFQAVSLTASNAQAGDWGTTPFSIITKTIANKKYIEHSAPQTTGVFEMPWVAPIAATGKVTFYASSLAANNNSQTSGDGSASGSLEVEENTTSSTSELGKEIAKVEVLPNPVSDVLNLQITSRSAGYHKLRIFDAAGNIVKTAPADLQVGRNTANVPVGELAPGLYLVQLCGDGHMAAVQMVKL